MKDVKFKLFQATNLEILNDNEMLSLKGGHTEFHCDNGIHTNQPISNSPDCKQAGTSVNADTIVTSSEFDTEGC